MTVILRARPVIFHLIVDLLVTNHCSRLFSHPDAEARFGASVFWVRQGMLPEDGMREFLVTWQIKRDGTLRGILEVKP